MHQPTTCEQHVYNNVNASLEM